MNRVFLMGRLTREPELRFTTSSNQVCNFTLAVDRRSQGQGEGRQTDFINIVAWNGVAGICSKYFTKGLRVAVEGRIQTRSWDDNEGKRHYITEVVADEVHFADGRKDTRGDAYELPQGGPLDDDDLPFKVG